jgi:hypothetical protein
MIFIYRNKCLTWKSMKYIYRNKCMSHSVSPHWPGSWWKWYAGINVCLILFPHTDLEVDENYMQELMGWDLAEWLERCASIPNVTGLNLSGGSESTFCSDWLLTARGGRTWALIEFASLLCYPGNTLCSQWLEPPGRAKLIIFNLQE